ncbi:MAG: hypothetical protein HZB34_13685 [Nitrospirae bacterium]|nr:hypothetical protein [Nitrospirota bacterium]
MTSKSEHERAVFLEFVRTASLPIDLASVESRPQGEPDIRCLLNDEPLYFELGRLLDQGMQRLKLKAMRIAPQQVSMCDYDVKLPEREMLRTKLAKHYETAGTPIELLLYYDNENWLVGDVPVFGDDFGWHADHVMLPLINETPHRFRRVWIYERHRPSVLWRYPV